MQALPPPPLEYKPKVKEKNKDASPAEKGKDVGKNKDSAVDKGKAKAVAAVPAKQRQYAPLQCCDHASMTCSCPCHIQSIRCLHFFPPITWRTALQD